MKLRTTRRRRRRIARPSLRFSPTAWAKLLYLRDLGDTEIGGFGLSAPDDPLLMVDLLTVRQRCTPVTVAFDDGAVADLFDQLVDQGMHPERFGRVWIHTHPGNCPLPSCVDEATFERVFGRTDWSVMAIVARNDAAYARLSFHIGPGGALEIPVRVDYGLPFDGTDRDAWEREYVEHVSAITTTTPTSGVGVPPTWFDATGPREFWEQEDFFDHAAELRSV